MFPHSPQSAVPPDKLVQQLIVQAIQAFYIQDYETGIYFLQQIKSNLPRYMYQLNPQMRSLAKEVVNIFNDNENIIGNSIPRLETHKYTLPQYVSLFINSENISNINIRNHILNKINTENLIKLI